MLFLFECIDDYIEFLMLDDLFLGNLILVYICEVMMSDVCQDVEVIGWLYQFYIFEKKDEVFDGLKKSMKIMFENIFVVIQFFIFYWIVCYLVENFFGCFWMFNCLRFDLINKMDYYI